MGRMVDRYERRRTVEIIEHYFECGDIISALEVAVVGGMSLEQFTVLYRKFLLDMRKEDEGK
jgi:hypothetical protein